MTNNISIDEAIRQSIEASSSSKITCYGCDTQIYLFESLRYNSNRYCEVCYQDLEAEILYHCNSCGRPERVTYHPAHEPPSPEILRSDNSGDYYCVDCCGICDSCGELYQIELLEDHLCDSCQPTGIGLIDDIDKTRIHNYDDEPDDWQAERMRWESVTYLGIELEMCFGDNQRSHILHSAENHLSRYLWKRDGSIGAGGELVSNPRTLQAHREYSQWRDFLAEASKLGARSHDARTCGLHVHINRAAFASGRGACAKYNIAKVCRFFEYNRVSIIAFSKRKDEQIARYCTIPSVLPPRTADNLRHTEHPHRFYAVNTEPVDTVEIRIFNGTLNYQRFWASVTFCDALIEFVRCHSMVSIARAGSWRLFCDFIIRANRYDFLVKYLKKQELLCV